MLKNGKYLFILAFALVNIANAGLEKEITSR